MVGKLLQYTDGSLYDYSQVNQVLENQASKNVSLPKKVRASTASMYLENRDFGRKIFRASTGNLLQINKLPSQTSKFGYRASTGSLKFNKGSTQTSHHHILARNLKGVDNILQHGKSKEEIKAVDQCSRCSERIKSQYFECINCPSYRLCAECGDGGIYCQDDTHSWVEYGRRYIGNKSQIIGKISSGEARTLYYGTKTFPSIFRPPSLLDTPRTLFSDEHRFIRNSNPREILIYADGACIRSSNTGWIAGWAFVYRPSAYSQDGKLTHAGTISGRLETRGPTGKIYKPTCNRAELRSTIAALQFIDWSKDCNRGWRSVVIATDSEYVTGSVTKWISDWEDANWKLEDKSDVNNKDLWELLLEEVRRYHSEGVKIAFWRIPRHCNVRAYEFAKRATGRGYKERSETVIFRPDGPVKVRVTPFSLQQEDKNQHFSTFFI